MLKSAVIVDLSTQIISRWIKDFNIKHCKIKSITVLPSFIVYNDLTLLGNTDQLFCTLFLEFSDVLS